MGKPLDNREVEFAYVKYAQIVPNIKDGDEYYTRIAIGYDLKDEDRQVIADKEVVHLSEKGARLTASEIVEYISANLLDFILEDKEDLSGYQPQ